MSNADMMNGKSFQLCRATYFSFALSSTEKNLHLADIDDPCGNLEYAKYCHFRGTSANTKRPSGLVSPHLGCTKATLAAVAVDRWMPSNQVHLKDAT